MSCTKTNLKTRWMCMTYSAERKAFYWESTEHSRLSAHQWVKILIFRFLNLTRIKSLFITYKSHLPSYLQNADKFHQKGYEVIALVTVNDPYVACSWKKELKSENKVRILADPMAEFTKVSYTNFIKPNLKIAKICVV